MKDGPSETRQEGLSPEVIPIMKYLEFARTLIEWVFIIGTIAMGRWEGAIL